MNQTTFLPTGTITFLFTDIEGSTKLWESQPDAMRVAVARHDVLLRRAVEDNDGYLFKTTGDGIAAAFAVAADGLAAALAAQQALTAEPWPEDAVLCSRMGLHTGAAELRDGDYFGSTLNRAARLMAAGHGGQTLISDVTYELCRDTLPADVSLLPLGEQRLKDLARPETIYQLAHPSLTAEFPPLRTLDNPDMPNNLPQQVTSFVGREKPLSDVAELLGKTRLLTLTGSGGSGKTRLSLQAAAAALDGYPDGAWLVELAALADPSLVPQTVAAVLGVREQAGPTLTQTLTENLKPRRLLLVLDNCEHLLGACAALVAALMRACPQVKVIATSREPLGIAGETTYRVPALSLPSASQAKSATPESLSQFEAVRLFVERAQAVKPDFAVTNANAPALAQLCYRLDGIPLAIELAAARVRSLSVEQINDKLDSRFRLLTGGDRSALPRQQTLRALIDWSYDLLTDQEKTLLARLSVFAGGCTLEAAEAIGGFDPINDWEVLDLLTSLADKSLVIAEEQSDEKATVRYRLLETVRQYAVERLSASGAGHEATNAALRHRDFFVALGIETDSQMRGPEIVVRLDRLETEHDNLRAALDTCVTGATGAVAESAEGAVGVLAGLRLSAALRRFWQLRGYLSEGREQLARALAVRHIDHNGSVSEVAQAQKAIAGALRAAGMLANIQGDYAAARSLSEESLSLFREIGDKGGIADTLETLGILAYNQGDYAATRLLNEERLSLYRESGDKGGIAYTLGQLGMLAQSQGDYAEARLLLGEALSLQREISNRHGIAGTLDNLGSVASAQGDYAAARVLHEESLSHFRGIGFMLGIAGALNNLGYVAYRQGVYSEARVLHKESLSLSREIGNKSSIADALHGMGHVAHEEGDFAAAWSFHAESLSLHRELGDKRGIAYGLKGLASVCVGEGDARRALVLLAVAGVLRDSMGVPLSPAERAEIDAELEKARAEVSEAAFAAAWDEGLAMPWEQAVELALKDTTDDHATRNTAS